MEANKSIVKLRQILNFLLSKGLLDSTDDEYPTLQLTEQAIRFLVSDDILMMKMVKEVVPLTKKAKTSKFTEELNYAAGDNTLFERLRELRADLAKDAHVPAYIVFTDKTLLQMSMHRPRSKEEMLAISGVAEAKYEKYGEVFLEEIKKFLDRIPKASVKCKKSF
jgi:ATP-dependent DNA helicase RecQ